MSGAFTRYLRGGWNLFLFVTGLRSYHWALSPLQQIVNYTASVSSRQRDNPFWQRVAVYAYALLKYRENCYFDGMNFVARLRGPLDQRALRNFVLWQDRMARKQDLPPGFRFNAALLVADPEEVQTDRLFSALCLSDTVNGLSIFWDREEADRAFRAPLGLTEGESLRWRAGEDIFDLGLSLPGQPALRHGTPSTAMSRAAPGNMASGSMVSGRADADDGIAVLRAACRNGVPRAFQPSLDPRRQVTHYIKIAHPRGYRLAVSLPETPDGFADASLPDWLPRLQALTEAQEMLTICLLNRFVHGADGSGKWPRGIHAVRQAGLTEQDAMAFAMEAEAFFGCLDIFGLAARSAARPGIYVGLDGGDGAPEVLVTADVDAPALFAALQAWWRSAESAGLNERMRAMDVKLSEDGPGPGNAAALSGTAADQGAAGRRPGLRQEPPGDPSRLTVPENGVTRTVGLPRTLGLTATDGLEDKAATGHLAAAPTSAAREGRE